MFTFGITRITGILVHSDSIAKYHPIPGQSMGFYVSGMFYSLLSAILKSLVIPPVRNI